MSVETAVIVASARGEETDAAPSPLSAEYSAAMEVMEDAWSAS